MCKKLGKPVKTRLCETLIATGSGQVRVTGEAFIFLNLTDQAKAGDRVGIALVSDAFFYAALIPRIGMGTAQRDQVASRSERPLTRIANKIKESPFV